MDIQILWNPILGQVGMMDLGQDGADLKTGRTLDTAIILSLFTNRRAKPDDVLPDYENSREGWWGDTYPGKEGDRIGSRLWLLRREKQTVNTLERAREYVREALQWLVDDGVAVAVDCEVEYDARRLGVLNIRVRVSRPNGAEDFRYNYAWDELVASIPGDETLEFREATDPLVAEDGSPIITEDGDGIVLE